MTDDALDTAINNAVHAIIEELECAGATLPAARFDFEVALSDAITPIIKAGVSVVEEESDV